MRLFENQGSATVSGSFSSTATILNTDAANVVFPVIDGTNSNEFAMITIENSSGNIEILKATERTSGSNTLTVVRAQEGTTARAWVDGDIVELRMTAASLSSFIQNDTDDVFDGGSY